MKKSLIVAGAVSLALAPTMALANAPVELNADQMDRITAGDLMLPNGKEIFDNFDNASGQTSGKGFEACGNLGFLDGLDENTGCHPALANRSLKSIEASGGNDGPWQAAVHSPVISCASNVDPGQFFPQDPMDPNPPVPVPAEFPCPAGSF